MYSYEEKFLNVCQGMFELGLKEHEKREEEIKSFFDSISDAQEENKNRGVKSINDYSEYKKKVGDRVVENGWWKMGGSCLTGTWIILGVTRNCKFE